VRGQGCARGAIAAALTFFASFFCQEKKEEHVIEEMIKNKKPDNQFEYPVYYS
jgi:hypothetical protein